VELRSASPELRAALEKEAADYSKGYKVRITFLAPRDGKAALGRPDLVIGWDFFGSGKGDVPIAARELASVPYGTAEAFGKDARGAGGWDEVPLLWDAWGIASAPAATAAADKPRSAQGVYWADRAAYRRSGLSLIGPGAESGLRQALFWAPADGSDRASMYSLALDGRLEAGKRLFESFSALDRDAALAKDALRLTRADLSAVAANPSGFAWLGSYSWARKAVPTSRLDFKPLAIAAKGGYTLPASVLAGAVASKGRSSEAAKRFLLQLCEPEAQRRLGEATGLMAANFNAPNLDPNSFAARESAIGASGIVTIDPEPIPGSRAAGFDSLLGAIAARPGEWERALAESEQHR
jgi:hypothetical protein